MKTERGREEQVDESWGEYFKRQMNLKTFLLPLAFILYILSVVVFDNKFLAQLGIDIAGIAGLWQGLSWARGRTRKETPETQIANQTSVPIQANMVARKADNQSQLKEWLGKSKRV